MRMPGAGGRTPSDLPLVALTQAEIERLERLYARIEDVLPLSPLQEGLLFHALYDAQAPDVYTVQLELALAGALESARLEQGGAGAGGAPCQPARERRHADLGRPVQVIEPQLTAPWRCIDLAALDGAERTARLTGILAQERAERFDLSAAPLIRFALIRLSAVEHRLVVTNHHIALDGWSMPVLVQELLALYAHKGDGAALPRVTPYRDYLAWIAGQDRDAAIAAWREALAGLEEATRVSPREGGHAPVAPEPITLALDEKLTGALTQQARRHGLTLNTVLQAAWAILLGRLSGREDVVFGVTVAGRPPEIAGIERMVGLFINTLPLRVKLAPGKPLLALLKEVQETQSRLMAHQHLGLAEIQSLAGLGELFDTLVVFENYPIDREGLSADAGGLRLTGLSGVDATHYPLSLAALADERGLRLRLSYRPDLFERSSVEAIAGRLVRLLEGALADPERSIGRLEILSAGEREQILREWNATARAVPAATLSELFAAQVAKTPQATAAVFEGESLSYGELDARANRLAHHLRTLGVGPEVVVGLCVERSLEMLVGLLGILKAGGAYLPLDPGYPRERLGFMLADACAPVLVTQAHLRARLPAHGGHVVCLDADADAIARHPATRPASGLDPQNPVYVIYTSGSTGPRRALWSPTTTWCGWCSVRIRRSDIRRRLSALGAAFVRCLDVRDLGRIAQRSQAGRLSGRRAGPRQPEAHHCRDRCERSVADSCAVPSSGRRGPSGDCGVAAVGGRRRSVCVACCAKIEAQSGGRVINAYGPTEGTTFSVCFPVTSRTDFDDSVPIGRPISNTRVYVLDAGLEPVAAGVCGELYIAGAGLGARLSGPCGADGGAVCGGPAWWSGEPDVPHRGPCALAFGRGAGVSGACGCAGEGARLPHRAWGDRGGAGGAWGYCAGSGDCARGRRRGSKRLSAYTVPASEQVICRPDIAPLAERQKILCDWNATARALPSTTFPELFAVRAAQTPDAIAALFEDQRLSYGALEARANQLAHHLRDLGVGPEVVVGLCVERSPEMLVGLLGILKAGGAYLPLDPGYPRERLAFMLSDACAPVLVTQSHLRALLPTHGAHVVDLDADTATIATAPHDRARKQRRAPTLRLRHLHFRIHRDPQRRRRGSRQPCQQSSHVGSRL